MLTRLYVEALLVNPDLAGQVWALWDAGLISDELAAWAWILIGVVPRHQLPEIMASSRDADALKASQA